MKANRRRADLKARLKASGHTYGDVARLADVTWRMVKFWIDGQRTSAKVDGGCQIPRAGVMSLWSRVLMHAPGDPPRPAWWARIWRRLFGGKA